jgi:hypothetical protein
MTRGGRRLSRPAGALAVVLVAAAASASCADLSAGYQGPRALVPPLAGPCWPLPAGVTLDVGYQVMQQYVLEDRWVLTAQWDLLSAEDFTASLRDSLVEGGFTARGTEDGWYRFEAPGYGGVAFDVTPLAGATPETPVQGTFRLDLPRDAARPRTTEDCTPIQKVDPPAEGASVMEGTPS